MNKYMINIASDKLLTEAQRARLFDRVREMLNGESSDFWDADEVEDVPELVQVLGLSHIFPVHKV